MKIKELSSLRQCLGEIPQDRKVTAGELYEMIEIFCPLMTKEQQKQLGEAIKKVFNN